MQSAKVVLTIASVAFSSISLAAGSLSCALSANTTYAPSEPWPFSHVDVLGYWSPLCLNFSCLQPPAFVGATAHVDGQMITLELYGSDDGLPATLPPVTHPGGIPSRVSVPLGPLTPGSYALQTNVHWVTNGVIADGCSGPLPAPYPVLIEAASGPVATVVAVEFYNAALDHYFLSASAKEIADLDSGVHGGWQRTGKQFNVFAPGESGGVGVPVCRFYAPPSSGIDSHFYTANAAECAELPTKYKGAWQMEGADVFEVRLPSAADGTCAIGFDPVFRAWNQRLDSNHRFITDYLVADQMVAHGYALEGWGGWRPVSMCAPH